MAIGVNNVSEHGAEHPASGDSQHQSTDELFLDVILQRHVRRLLSAGRLRDLGYLAANFDCPLVAWLGRERTRAARVDDFVSAARRVHSDFDWPYPNVMPSPAGASGGRKLSGGGRPASLEEKLQALEVDVTPTPPVPPYLGLRQQHMQLDSGYLSHASNGVDAHIRNGSPLTSKPPGTNGGLLLQTVEAQLKPVPPTRN